MGGSESRKPTARGGARAQFSGGGDLLVLGGDMGDWGAVLYQRSSSSERCCVHLSCHCRRRRFVSSCHSLANLHRGSTLEILLISALALIHSTPPSTPTPLYKPVLVCCQVCSCVPSVGVARPRALVALLPWCHPSFVVPRDAIFTHGHVRHNAH